MSGHSKWANIKHTKGKMDALKGKIFSKWAREITIAAKQGGGDPAGNPRLRLAIEKSRAANMPRDNIERAIQKGIGGGEAAALEEVTYEGYGPGGVAIFVEAVTDNRNRTASEIRYIFDRNGGSMSAAGTVMWMFKKQGMIYVDKKATSEEDLLSQAVDAGALDIVTEENAFQVVTPTEKFEAVKEALQKGHFSIISADITHIPQNTVTVEGDAARHVLRLVQALEDHEDVQNVHANFDVPDAILAEVGAATK